jgi:hypothetical protein
LGGYTRWRERSDRKVLRFGDIPGEAGEWGWGNACGERGEEGEWVAGESG